MVMVMVMVVVMMMMMVQWQGRDCSFVPLQWQGRDFSFVPLFLSSGMVGTDVPFQRPFFLKKIIQSRRDAAYTHSDIAVLDNIFIFEVLSLN